MNRPLVSIITPTFNHRPFIEQCVRSVLQQTYRRWEMVVVDDASSDGTTRLVEEVAAADRRVKLIVRSRHRGAEALADAYNSALAASDGELVAVVEGDDWWTPDRLSSQVPVLVEDESLALAYGDCWEVSQTGDPIGYVVTPISEQLRSSVVNVITHFSRLASVPANTVLLRRDALERAGGFRSEGLPIVDYPTWLEVGLQGNFVRIPRPIAFWRRHAGSVYWRNLARVTVGCHEVFHGFVERNKTLLRSAGVPPGTLIQNVDDALLKMLSSLSYFDAKYELLCGDRTRALLKLLRVLAGRRTSLRHRLAGLVGIAAGLSSPELFRLATLSARRPRRPASALPAGSGAGGVST